MRGHENVSEDQLIAPGSVQGTADPSFKNVDRVFRENFSNGLEIGASLCVYRRGTKVVDLWGGFADQSKSDPWRRDTLGILASPTKTLVTGATLHLVERGELCLEDRIVDHWPEFGRHGKGDITLRMVMAQRSGVVCLDHAPITADGLKKHFPIVAAIEDAEPEWSPGEQFGYHALTYGHLLSEVIRRRTGLTVGRYFSQEIGMPLGLNCYIGVPKSLPINRAYMHSSVAEEIMDGESPGRSTPLLTALNDSTSLTYRATIASMSLVDEPDALVENPSYDGLSTAASLARYFAALIGSVDGFRVVGEGLSNELLTVQSSGTCQVLLLPATWGLGVMLPDGPTFPASSGLSSAFGIGGANGNFVYADPRTGIAFAYVQNAGSKVIGTLDSRVRRLIEEVNVSAHALMET